MRHVAQAILSPLPFCFKLSLPLSGPRNSLLRDEATMDRSGMRPLSIPSGEKHVIFGGPNK